MGPSSFEDALKEYEKKFKDKSGHKWEDRSEPAKKGKYTFLERNYEDDDDDAADQVKDENEEEKPVAESKLPKQTQRLMELIFNQNHFNSVLEQIGYNANKLPLGKLSKSTLKQGFEHLNELASLIKHPTLAQNKYDTSQKEVSKLSSELYMPPYLLSKTYSCQFRLLNKDALAVFGALYTRSMEPFFISIAKIRVLCMPFKSRSLPNHITISHSWSLNDSSANSAKEHQHAKYHKHRQSKTSPTNTTPPSPTNSAATAPHPSTATRSSAKKPPCSTPSPTWKSPTQS